MTSVAILMSTIDPHQAGATITIGRANGGRDARP